jgi:hypothetical protein
MDIEEIRKTIDRLNGFMNFVEKEHDFGLKAKDFELAAFVVVCDLREDNLTIDFAPWIEALEVEWAKNPKEYEVIIKRDRTFTLPKPREDLSGNPFKLLLALKSLDDEEYKNLRGEFVNILDILYHVSEDMHHDSDNVWDDSKSDKYPFPLPYHGEVEDIANIFGKSF